MIRKNLRNMVLAGITAFVAGTGLLSAQDAQEMPKGFSYSSPKLSLDLNGGGGIKSLRLGDTTVINNGVVHGTYKYKGEKHDNRFFQKYKSASPMMVKKTGDNTYEATVKCALGNKKYKEAATFTETVAMTPTAITFTYDLELLVPLASQSHLFSTILYCPAKTLAGRGFKVTKKNDATEMKTFPPVYEKNNRLHAAGEKAVMISLKNGVLSMDSAEGSAMSMIDTRSWGGKKFRFDFAQRVPWKSKPKTFPAGTKFKWSFTIGTK